MLRRSSLVVRPPAIQTHNSWKPTVLRPSLAESEQPVHSLWHASTVTHIRRGETDHRLLIDYYKTIIDYEKTEFNIPNFIHKIYYMTAMLH